MCCVVAQLLKVALTVLHLLLVIVFGILAVVGALLKSGKLTKSIVEKIFPGESIDDTQKEALTVFLNNSLGSVGTIIVSVGVVCLLFCLFGWIASCCPCGILLKLYAVLLGVILVMQISFTGYVFGSPDYLPGRVLGLLNETLKSYNEDPNKNTARVIWSLVMTSNGEICCGLGGYKNFTDLGMTQVPGPCCITDAENLPPSCDAETAKNANVPGCTDKITAFVEAAEHKILPIPIVLIFLLLALQVVVILAAAC
ncbi:hypothetical protein AAHC03_024193 [Spirometra sp. Aus1]